MDSRQIEPGQLRTSHGHFYTVIGPTEKDGVWWVLTEGELERWWYDGIDCDEVVE